MLKTKLSTAIGTYQLSPADHQ